MIYRRGTKQMTETEALWQRAILPTTATIRDAIQTLNEVAIKIVLISDGNGVLKAQFPRDIRRGCCVA